MMPVQTALLGIVVVGMLVLVDAGLIGATLLRFRRSRLLLE